MAAVGGPRGDGTRRWRPMWTLDGPVPVTVEVANRGPGAARGTTLIVAVPGGMRVDGLRPARGTCDAAGLRCELGAVTPGETVGVVVDLVGLVPGRQRVTWSVAGDVLDVRPSDNAAQTVIPVRDPVTSRPPEPALPPPPPAAGPGLAVVVQPDPSYVGGRATVSYTVRNGGGGLATGLRLDFELPAQVPVATLPPGCSATGCALPDLPSGRVPGGAGGAGAERTPAHHRARHAAHHRHGRRPGRQHRRARRCACSSRGSSPCRPIGEPGFVTSVRGVDFPPGAPVRLAWTPGITAAAAPTIPRARRPVHRAAADPGQGPDRAAHDHRERPRLQPRSPRPSWSCPARSGHPTWCAQVT